MYDGNILIHRRRCVYFTLLLIYNSISQATLCGHFWNFNSLPSTAVAIICINVLLNLQHIYMHICQSKWVREREWKIHYTLTIRAKRSLVFSWFSMHILHNSLLHYNRKHLNFHFVVSTRFKFYYFTAAHISAIKDKILSLVPIHGDLNYRNITKFHRIDFVCSHWKLLALKVTS